MSTMKNTAVDKWDKEFEVVGGLDAQINEIRERIFIPRMLNKKLMQSCNLTPPRGALLYGSPGTGKTLLVRTLCKSLNIPDPKVISGPEIFGKFIGDSEAAVRAIFEPAKTCKTLYVVIIDEIDSMCRARSNSGGGAVDGTRDSVVCQFLACIDGFHVNENLVIFATTNRKDLLDPALLRPGRLEVHIEIPVPSETARHQILEVHTRSLIENSLLAKSVNLKQLATLTVGFSGADLKALVNQACVLAIRTSPQFIKGGYNNLVKMKKISIDKEHFNQSLKSITPSNNHIPSVPTSSSQSTIAPGMVTSALSKEQNHPPSKKIDAIAESLKNLKNKHGKLQTKYKALREEMVAKDSKSKAKNAKKKYSKGSSSDESSSESETDNLDSESDESSEESDSEDDKKSNEKKKKPLPISTPSGRQSY